MKATSLAHITAHDAEEAESTRAPRGCQSLSAVSGWPRKSFPDMELRSMTAIRGAAAAVTGAASGIGRALAFELAARGCDLALADRDEAGLQAVAAEIGRAHPRKVSTHRVDVGEPVQIAEFAAAASAAHPKLNIVIHNAGVALLGQFNEIE